MSSPASPSHLNSSDSSEEQIYSVESRLQSRLSNEGLLPLSTFYGTKNLPTSDSPSKNLRARKLDFGDHSPDSDLEILSPVSSPIDDSDDDHHWVPHKKGSSSDDNAVPAHTVPKTSKTSNVVPQVQQAKKRGRPAGSKNKKPRATKKSRREITSLISTPTAASPSTQAVASTSTPLNPSSPLLDLTSPSTSTIILPQYLKPQPVAKRSKGPGRKAKSNPTQWRRNKAKHLHAQGLAYVSSRGKNVPAAKIGTKCTCQNKCLDGEHIPHDVIKAVNNAYFELGDQPVVKDQYLQNLITTRPVKRVRTKVPGKAPKTQYTYCIRYEGIDYVVCKSALGSIHSCSETRINRLIKDKFSSPTGTPRQRLSGKSTPSNKVPEWKLERVHEFIGNLAVTSSHYTRASTPHRRYLSAEVDRVTIKDIFLNYIEWHKTKYPECDSSDTVTEGYFKQVFTTQYNIVARKPRQDQCDFCSATVVDMNSKVCYHFKDFFCLNDAILL